MKQNFIPYIFALFISFFVIELKLSLNTFLGNLAPFHLSLLAVIISALYGGFGAGLFALLLTSTFVCYFFLLPPGSFMLSQQSLMQVGVYILEGVIVVVAIEQVRKMIRRERLIREKFEVTLASIGQGVISTDNNGKITFMNSIAENLIGVDFREAKDSYITEVVSLVDGQQKSLENPALLALSKGKIIELPSDSYLRTRYGREIAIDDTAAPIWDKKNKLIGSVLVFRDVSDRRALEEQRDLLMGVASHEIKNNIAGLKGFTQILARSLEKEESTNLTYVERIQTKVDALIRIISNTMDVTKIKKGMLDITQEDFDLAKLVQDIVAEQQLSTKQHQLMVTGETSIRVIADKVRTGQVLINLISNAIKYSPQAEKIAVSVGYKDQMAVVGVRDFGIGIPKDKQPKLFEPFYRAVDGKKVSIAGSGLGLYVASEIIKNNGGTMWLHSKEGKGTTFFFTLPLSKHIPDDKAKLNDSAMHKFRVWFTKLWE